MNLVDAVRSVPLRWLLVLAPAASASAQNCVFNFGADPLTSILQPSLEPIAMSNQSPPLAARIAQFVVSRYRFQNAPVLISGLAFSMTFDGAMSYQTLRIRLAHTANNSLSGFFAANFATPPQTVLDTHDYVWPHRFDQWTEIGLQTPFLYVPGAGNLLIEVRCTGVVSSNVSQANGARCYVHTNSEPVLMVVEEFQTVEPIGGSVRNFAPMVRLCTDLALLQWTGVSCAGSGGTRPALGFAGASALGATTDIVLSNARPSQLALLGLGFDVMAPLPRDLTAVGMPGCWQYVAPAQLLVLTTGGSGVAAHPLAVPLLPALAGTCLFAQYFVADAAANAAGLVTTNLGRIQIGY